MKLFRFTPVLFAGIVLAACTDMNEIKPQSGTMLASQKQETIAAVPSRATASFTGLFRPLGNPNYADDAFLQRPGKCRRYCIG